MDADAGYPLILYGPSGSGKTTVMASIAKHCHLWNQDAAVVVRFANASAYSSSLEQTLNSLIVQLNFVDSGKCTWFKHVSFVSKNYIFFNFVNFTLPLFSGRTIVLGTNYTAVGFNWIETTGDVDCRRNRPSNYYTANYIIFNYIELYRIFRHGFLLLQSSKLSFLYHSVFYNIMLIIWY